MPLRWSGPAPRSQHKKVVMYPNPGARRGVILVASLALAACGGDGPSAPQNTGNITQARAAAMMDALAQAGGFGFDGGGPAAAPARTSATLSVSKTVPCPGGGSIQLDGHYAADAGQDGTGTYVLDVTQEHQGCTATASGDGSTWTFDGAPNVAVHFEIGVTAGGYTISGTQKGGVAWQSGGDSGTCQVDVTYDFSGSQDAQSFSGSVSGSVCGYPVSESVDVTG